MPALPTLRPRPLRSSIRTGTVVIGAGQAGLAASHELSARGHDHVVVERDRVGHVWRRRPDSLRLLTPNWLNRLPGSPPHADADGFLPGARFADYLARYAESFGAPVQERSRVESVQRVGHHFRVETTRGTFHAADVVIATGDAAVPRLPAVARTVPRGVTSMHAGDYRAPGSLADGGVLVVGAGASGEQIALETRQAGRDVVLAVGRHVGAPRRWRGQDIWNHLVAIGHPEVAIDEMPDPAAARRAQSFSLTAGRELDLEVLTAAGCLVTGRLAGIEGSVVHFADDLRRSVERSHRKLDDVLARVDAHLGVPHREPHLPVLPAAPVSLDLRAAGIGTVIWATGYRREYPWLQVPVLDGAGEIRQHHGLTPVPGLSTLGLRFQRKRKSHLIGGVGEDASVLAARIAAERSVEALAAWRERARLRSRARRVGAADDVAQGHPGRNPGALGLATQDAVGRKVTA